MTRYRITLTRTRIVGEQIGLVHVHLYSPLSKAAQSRSFITFTDGPFSRYTSETGGFIGSPNWDLGFVERGCDGFGIGDLFLWTEISAQLQAGIEPKIIVTDMTTILGRHETNCTGTGAGHKIKACQSARKDP
jgi:hypothetical protein